MLKLTLLLLEFPDSTARTWAGARTTYVSPGRVDTITPVSAADRTMQSLPAEVRSVVRYTDMMKGYRLMYASEEAADLVKNLRREMRGEDSSEPVWS